MRIAVTGAGGFIPGHFIARLLAEGHDVVGVDIKPRDEWWQIHDGVEVLAGFDLADPRSSMVALEGCDATAHMACPMGGIKWITEQLYDCARSAMITTHVLDAAIAHRHERLYLSSSACAYNVDLQDDPDVTALSEDMAHPLNGEPGYGLSKGFEEQLARYAAHDNAIETRIGRYHNIYGTCYDDQTEVLTRDGFKLFVNVTDHDEIATRNPLGVIEYHRPLARQAYPYAGPMVRLKARSYDLLVTPDHEVTALEKRTDRKLVRMRADEMGERPVWFVRSASWDGEEVAEHVIPPVAYTESPTPFDHRMRNGRVVTHNHDRTKPGATVDMDDWLEFLGWFISEGSTTCRKRPGVGSQYMVSIRQYDLDHLAEIEDVVRRMGFHPSISEGRVTIHSKALHAHLAPLGKSHQKFVPTYAKQLSPRQLRILFTSLIKGDGSHAPTHKKGLAYWTKSPRLADDVSEIAFKLGYGVSMSFRDAQPERHKSELYSLSIGNLHTTNRCSREHVSREEYRGMVYDVTVPNHTILVRRNGRSVWSGNCGTWDGGKEKAPAAVCRKIATAVLTGNPEIEVWGDGTATRSYCWIDDCVEGTLRLMASDHGDPLNIGSAELISVDDLYHLVAKIAGLTDYELVHDLSAPRGVAGRLSDNTLCREVLDGWEPATPLADGMAKLYEWVYSQVAATL